jgi:uncharacterized protein with HEPN domain
MSKDDRVRVLHAMEAAQKAVSFLDGREREDVDTDEMLSLAVVRLLEIVGEAASQITQEFRRQHADVPWRYMTELRNRLIHGYFDINLDVVWDTVNTDFPPMIAELERVLETMSENQ